MDRCHKGSPAVYNLNTYKEQYRDEFSLKLFPNQHTVNTFDKNLNNRSTIGKYEPFAIIKILLIYRRHGSIRFLSNSKELGMFGWLTDINIVLFLLFIFAPFFFGVLVNVWFYAAYHYWPMEIIAGTILLYPFLSQVVGVALGLDAIPGFRTLFGLTIVTIATLLSSYGSKLKAINTVQKIWDEENIPSKVQMSFLGSMRKLSSEVLSFNDSTEK